MYLLLQILASLILPTCLVYLYTKVALKSSPIPIRVALFPRKPPPNTNQPFSVKNALLIGLLAVGGLTIVLLVYVWAVPFLLVDWEPWLKILVGSALGFWAVGLIRQRIHGLTELQTSSLYAAVLAISCFWLLVPSWLTLDLMAITLGLVVVISLQPRVSFLQVGIVLFVLAVLYDVVQVFFLPFMIPTVRQAMAPLTMGVEGIVPPAMLMIPQSLGLYAPSGSIMGMGDVALPTILVITAARAAQRTSQPLLFRTAIAGYVVGLLLTIFSFAIFRIAQPATIFLIPAICGAVLWAAKRRKVLPSLKEPQYTYRPQNEG